jgi:hypothetical protein
MRLNNVAKEVCDGLFLARCSPFRGQVALAERDLRQDLLCGRAGLIRRDSPVAAQNRALDRESPPTPRTVLHKVGNRPVGVLAGSEALLVGVPSYVARRSVQDQIIDRPLRDLDCLATHSMPHSTGQKINTLSSP